MSSSGKNGHPVWEHCNTQQLEEEAHKHRHALARDPAYRGGEVTVGNQVVGVSVETVATDTRTVIAETSVDVPGGAGLPVRRRFQQTLRLGDGLPTVTGWRELN